MNVRSITATVADNHNFSLFQFHPINSPLKIPKLAATDQSRYRAWKLEVKGILASVGLDSFIKPDENKSLQDAIDDDHNYHKPHAVLRVWKAIHRRIYGAIQVATIAHTGEAFYDNIEKEQIKHEIEAKRDGKEVSFIYQNTHRLMERLDKKYDTWNHMQIQDLLRQLFSNLKHDKLNDPEVVLKQYEAIINELEKNGVIISEVMKASVWFGIIPKDWSSITMTLACRKDIGWNEVYEALVSYYKTNVKVKASSSRSNLGSVGNKDTEDVQYADIKGRIKDKKKKVRRKKTPEEQVNLYEDDEHDEGDDDHTEDYDDDDYDADEVNLNETSNQKKTMTCQYCNMSGHTALKCFKLRDEISGKRPTGGKDDRTGYPKDTQFLGMFALDEVETNKPRIPKAADEVLFNDDNIDESEGIVDSGTRRTITPYEELLHDIEELETPVMFKSASRGYMKATHVGKLRVSERTIIPRVYLVKGASRTLISEIQIIDSGQCMFKDQQYAYILRQNIPRRAKLQLMRLIKENCTARISRCNTTGFYMMKLRSFNRPDHPLFSRSRDTLPAFMKYKQSGDHKEDPASDTSLVEDCCHVESLSPIQGKLISSTTPKMASEEPSDLLHEKLGHPSPRVITELIKQGVIKGDAKLVSNMAKTMSECHICVITKSTRQPVGERKDTQNKATRAGMIIHGDLVMVSTISRPGGAHHRCRTVGGNLYALVLVDEYTRFVWVYLLKNKDDAAGHIIKLFIFLRGILGLVVEIFRSDRGGEFINTELSEFFASYGCRYASTPSYTPALNGLVERMNRSLFERVRALLLQAQAPYTLWGEATLWAVHLHNTLPNPANRYQTPYKMLFNYTFPLHKAHIFGCDVEVNHNPELQSKLQPRTWPGMFIGYSRDDELFKIMDFNSKIHKVRDVRFFDMSFKNMKTYLGNQSGPNEYIRQVVQESQQGQEHHSNLNLSGDIIRLSDNIIRNDYNNYNNYNNNNNYNDQDDHKDNHNQNNNISTTYNQGDWLITDSGTVRHISGDPKYAPAENVNDSTNTNSDDNINIGSSPDDEKDESSDEEEQKSMIAIPKQKRGRGTQLDKLLELQTDFSSWNKYKPSNRESILPNYKEKNVHDENSAQLVEEHIETEEVYYIEEVLELQQYDAVPMTYKQALKSKYAKEWIAGMKSEYQSMKDKDVFTEVVLPKGKRVLPCRPIYAYKLNPDGSIKRFKFRLVVGGHKQIAGIDYNETFSPVIKKKSLSVIFSIANKSDYEIKQIDFKTAFLNSLIHEEIYIPIPPGYEAERPGTVLKLNKSVYGTHQAGRNWNKDIDKLLLSLGFNRLKADPCVYYKKSRTGRLIITGLYVDDQTIIYHKDDEPEWLEIKKAISDKYEITDVGDCEWILNIKVIRNREAKTITLSQELYVKQLLQQFGLEDIKPRATPYSTMPIHQNLPDGQPGEELSKEDHARYRSMIGGLLYLANTTRVDICFIVNRLSQFLNKPMKHHMRAAVLVFRYLKSTMNYGLVFRTNNNIMDEHDIRAHGIDSDQNKVIAYSDADWATDVENRKSVSGGIITHNGNIVSWFSKKQELTAMSTMEAEYIALAAATKDVKWYRNWIQEVYSVLTPSILLCDNTAAISFTKDDRYHQRTRHIDLRYHFVKEYVESKDIEVKYISTERQLADILTKCLSKDIFIKFRDIILTKI